MSGARRRTRVLVISHDVIGARMAGPGMRYQNLARVLAAECDVTLAAPNGADAAMPDVEVLPYSPSAPDALTPAIARADVVLVAAPWLAAVPELERSTAAVVIDGYDPCLAEALLLPEVDLPRLVDSLTRAYLRGDFFICAGERQRDWWLGLLEGHGRLNRHTIAEDPSLRRLLAAVPFGLPAEPLSEPPAVIPGVRPGDRLVLWGGGLWDWLDPETAVRAMPLVLERRPDVKLLFPGRRHPDPKVGATRAAEATEALARSLGLHGSHVVFGEWVPRERWPGYLARADVGLSLHRDTVEARLAFRTRVLDYLWAGLPMVLSEADETASMAQRFGAAALVPPGDERAVARAILAQLGRPHGELAAGFGAARHALTWERAARPLIEFCRAPRQAPDRVALGDQLGNLYYLARLNHVRALLDGYERGRFIRMMKWLKSAARRTG